MVRTGAEVLLNDRFDLVEGKRLGVITNHSALLPDGEHLVRALLRRREVKLAALFGPEHGITGSAPDRRAVKDGRDELSGVPIYSLFGKVVAPTKRMLAAIDILLFDLQDVGTRFYTYSTTLALTMGAAANQGIPYIVLDRPNPIRGTWIEGAIRDESLRSFTSWLTVPVIHGLSIGELALLINQMGWLQGKRHTALTVVPMAGWKRSMWYDQTGLSWTSPSPSIRTVETAVVYPGTCFIEATNVSEGRGTDRPFENIGAPWISGRHLASELNSYRLPGVIFEPVSFTPRKTRKLTTDSKYENVRCSGVHLTVTDRNRFEPVRTGIYLLMALSKLYPTQLRLRNRRLDELTGDRAVRSLVRKASDPEALMRSWSDALRQYDLLRQTCFLYKL